MALFVQGKGLTQGVTHSVSGTFTTAPTAGHMIVVVAEATNGPTIVSGGGVSVWTKKVAQLFSTAGELAIWYGLANSGSNAAITITETGAGFGSVSGAIIETAIVAATGDPSDGTNSAKATSANSSPGSITPTVGGQELIVSATWINNGPTNTTGPTNGFTALTGAGTGNPFSTAYLDVASAAGSYTSGFGSGNNYAVWAAVIAAFKLTVVASGSPSLSLLGCGA